MAGISSRKLKVAIFVLGFALMLSIGAMIGVLAATTQNYKTGFEINYTVGEHVIADVRTEYYIPNSGKGPTAVTTTIQGQQLQNTNGYVSFSASDPQTTKSVYIGSFELTPETTSIEFYITFKNSLASGSGYMQVVMSEEITKNENFNVSYKYYNTSSFDQTASATTIADDLFTNASTDNVVAQGYKIVKVVFTVANPNVAASCAGAFDFGLYFAGQNATSNV